MCSITSFIMRRYCRWNICSKYRHFFIVEWDAFLNNGITLKGFAKETPYCVLSSLELSIWSTYYQAYTFTYMHLCTAHIVESILALKNVFNVCFCQKSLFIYPSHNLSTSCSKVKSCYFLFIYWHQLAYASNVYYY